MRVILSLIAALSLSHAALAQEDPEYGQPSDYSEPIDSYSEDEVVDAVADFFGVTAEAAASVLERVFSDLGRPVGYVAGEEVAVTVTLILTQLEMPKRRAVKPKRGERRRPSTSKVTYREVRSKE